MTLAGFKRLQIGLDGLSIFQKEHAHGVTENAADKSLRVFDLDCAPPRSGVTHGIGV